MTSLNKQNIGNLKTERELLAFGVDWVTLNLGKFGETSQALHFLNDIFSIEHNDTNASEYRGFMWDNVEVNLSFEGEMENGEKLNVFKGEYKIIQIIRINPDKNKLIKYQYQIGFYGTFFSLGMCGELEVMDYVNIFMKDVKNKIVSHSISRNDIFADISNIGRKEIQKGIKGDRLKTISEIKRDMKTGEMQTFYYGDKRRDKNKNWLARVYNKLNDLFEKGKEKLHSKYFEYKEVTRIETEVRSEGCFIKGINLLNVFDMSVNASVFFSLLENKYNSWKIAKFVKKELKKRDFAPFLIQNHYRDNVLVMTRSKAFTDLQRKIEIVSERFDVELELKYKSNVEINEEILYFNKRINYYVDKGLKANHQSSNQNSFKNQSKYNILTPCP